MGRKHHKGSPNPLKFFSSSLEMEDLKAKGQDPATAKQGESQPVHSGREPTLGNVRAASQASGAKLGKNPASGLIKGKLGDYSTAPYNFIPYYPGSVSRSAPHDPRETLSGTIECTLTALAPLLVGGPMDRNDQAAAKERRFFKVGGQYVIPGSSLKGMLRNYIEITSFSRMSLVSDDRIFWRNVTGKTNPKNGSRLHGYGQRRQGQSEKESASALLYKQHFDSLQDRILGGYLVKQGSRYVLYPAVEVRRGKPSDAGPGERYYETGKFGKNAPAGYIFGRRSENPRKIAPEVMHDFLGQMTPAVHNPDPKGKQGIWDSEYRKLSDPSAGAAVFYLEDANHNVTNLGTCRYFRIPYEHSPRYFAGEQDPGDFANGLFGCVGQGRDKAAQRGRVSVSPCRVSGREQRAIKAILGQPHASALQHYLVQADQGKAKYNLDDFKTYDSEDARLRGHKYYWHRDYDPGEFRSNGNEKVQSELYPLGKGANGTFTIRVTHINKSELGALLEALSLPDGHAHKLGSGKSLGFGSVRIEIKGVYVQRDAERYASLSSRLEGRRQPMGEEEQQLAIAAFKSQVVPEGMDYDSTDTIRCLRAMTLLDHPSNSLTATMELNSKEGNRVSFKDKALLLNPLQIISQSRK